MNSLFNISGNVTVITGGTGVLGSTIAKYLAKNGAIVIILGRKADVGNSIAAEICAAGGVCEFMQTDVMDIDLVKKNCEDIVAKYGRVDTLLNAAGGNMKGAMVNPDQTFFNLDINQFQKVVDLNLTGTVIPTQVFLDPMVRQGQHHQLCFDVVFPSYYTRRRLCSCKGWNYQLYGFHGYRMRQEVRRGYSC